MTQLKVRGLVLREYEAGESDKRLIIFCKGQGRLMVYARGARKPTSKFMAAAQLFTYADFVLTQGRGFYSLSQAEIIENFYALREDYDRLMSAHMVAEVCEKTMWDNLEGDELLRLALKSLSVLAKGLRVGGASYTAKEVPPMQVSSVFIMRFFAVYGLRPQTNACVMCNSPTLSAEPDAPHRERHPQKMVLSAEGLVCDIHKPIEHQPLSNAAISAMQYILNNELAQAFHFTARDDILAELHSAAHFLWKCHFERDIVSDRYTSRTKKE